MPGIPVGGTSSKLETMPETSDSLTPVEASSSTWEGVVACVKKYACCCFDLL